MTVRNRRRRLRRRTGAGTGGHRRRLLPDPLDGDQSDGAFEVRERTAAENFARAARRVQVPRIIYLGGPMPTDGSVSPHLASRLDVEDILLAATPCSVAFRASIVIGAGSRSFRFLVRLVERLPILMVPAWRTHRSAPIDERDMIELLARAATSDVVCGQSLDAGGPDIVSYGELIDRIRDHMLLARPTIRSEAFDCHPDRQPNCSCRRRGGSRADRTADGKPRARPATA